MFITVEIKDYDTQLKENVKWFILSVILQFVFIVSM